MTSSCIALKIEGVLDPGRLGILLQIEAVVGIGSAALLAGEPFGAREAIGAILVVSASLVEVIGNAKSASADSESQSVRPLSGE